MPAWLKLLTAVLLLSGLAACASTPQTQALQHSLQYEDADALPRQALISDLPFFAQDDYQCGPAALATMLVHSGSPSTPEALVPMVYVPARKGSFQPEMSAAARSHARLVYTLEPQLETVLTEVAAGHPVLVLQNLALNVLPRWHFAVVKGYDLERGRIVLNSGRHENYEVSLPTFERTWARASHWAQVVLPPDTLPVSAEPQALFAAIVALQESGQSDSAALAYGSGLTRWPDNQELLMGAGNLAYASGDSADALARFERLTRLYPDYAPAHNNLALLLQEQGEHARALQHAQSAVALGGAFLEQYQATLEGLLP
ncbi:MAG TPA: PA2778 family cysteine peptidase [Pseudomonadaceae bacterium]|nr:PA2778 family cysteine peptidase [Pseudomonadaceae bacterium]